MKIPQNTTYDLDSIIQLSREWLINSGIQNINKAEDINGAFNSWYDAKRKSYAFAYPEITGYGITALLYLNKTKNKNTVLRAELAAKWLIKYALYKSGGIKVRCDFDIRKSADSFLSGDFLYAFDSGMVLFGFSNLYRNTKKIEYLEAAKKISKFLISLQRPDGSFFPIYDIKNNMPVDSKEKWSTQSGSFHVKLALGFLSLFEITRNTEYRDVVLKICKNSLRLQEKSGRFITSIKDNSTHMHPHCYSIEGFLYAGLCLKNNEFIESAAKATRWLLNRQLDSGGIPCMYVGNKIISYERSDILAQALRLGVILSQRGILEGKFRKKIVKLLYRLISFQCRDKSIAKKGGFRYGFESDGGKKDDINSWCTMFSLQALTMYQQMTTKGGVATMELFI